MRAVLSSTKPRTVPALLYPLSLPSLPVQTAMQVSWCPLDSTTGLLLAATFLLSLLWLRATRRPPGLPPGPGPALPLLGHLYLLKKDPRAQFRQWRRQYGDVFSFYMGSRLVVVLAGYSTLRQALVKMADVFSERPLMFFTEKVNKNEGKRIFYS